VVQVIYSNGMEQMCKTWYSNDQNYSQENDRQLGANCGSFMLFITIIILSAVNAVFFFSAEPKFILSFPGP
jgi:hypothetical protein